MDIKPYGLICPIIQAAELLEPRWTIPILTEMWGGSSRFNDIRRGVGNISPALLSRRLKSLEAVGLIERVEDPATGSIDYLRTAKARALEPVLDAMARWALVHCDAEESCDGIEVTSLMWVVGRKIASDLFPPGRTVLRFHFADDDLEWPTWHALVRPGAQTEMCTDVPGYDVDLYIETTVPALAATVQGRSTIGREIAAERLFVTGAPRLARTMEVWMPRVSYADTTDGIGLFDAGRGRSGTAPRARPNSCGHRH
ncbi:winged helix-turn-helix transcriptional regulator [Jannaschia seohaensis]|uniref:DNA-binding HxlR family transcriptional regulator n=1 Tax=Jannaschia seohaensis TaxID=475081 RepID=A0A2Y9AMW1_9RHOB|nr:helix-turn-helix domain-containing protein [Jannaschia seohaensis]PWJ19085.1 DNA-binding HxlR family transcriptional regulator [Jannaschia seohaensis]SSA45700.1 DNA-binding transcriptional regulator, HxlR family [Jannaschia seohaensis]